MNPVQRILSIRWPVGFDSTKNLPSWTFEALSQTQRELLFSKDFPNSYLAERCRTLEDYLLHSLEQYKDQSQAKVDVIASTLERLKNVSDPRRTTQAWFRYLLHYGHTVSGVEDVAKNNLVFAAIRKNTGLEVDISTQNDRELANSRWLVRYTKGIMDTDAISDFVYGDIYIPISVKITVNPVNFSKSWKFPSAMNDAVSGFTTYFQKPFWANYSVNGNTRSLKLSNKITLDGTLTNQGTGFYRYQMEGLQDLTVYNASLNLEAEGDSVLFKYSAQFNAGTSEAMVRTCNYFSSVLNAMGKALHKQFNPGEQ